MTPKNHYTNLLEIDIKSLRTHLAYSKELDPVVSGLLETVEMIKVKMEADEEAIKELSKNFVET